MNGCLERGGSRGILEEELMKEESWVMWIVFALLSAVFAALTSILAKIGIDGVNSNLATAVRTVVVVVMSWLMVFVTNNQNGLSGIATGASWLCYYKALQMGSTTEVAAVDKLSIVFTLVLAFFFLHDTFTVKSLIGCALIATGTIIMVWK